MRGIGRVSDGASVAFAGIGTLTGGNLGHSRTEDDY